jgi:hypothetical protein
MEQVDISLTLPYSDTYLKYFESLASPCLPLLDAQVLTSQRYSDKADVYSFAIVMWECLTKRLPYEGMTAMQAGMGVATMGLRPPIPYSGNS